MIGAFIVGGAALALAAVIFLASGILFSPYSTYVSYFSEPVNGLSVGAAVKYRGIQLGQVDKIGLFDIEGGNDLAEVRFRLEHQRIVNLGGEAENITDENMAKLVREGLRSRLEVESIVTGVVYITLEFKEDLGPPILRNPESDYVEIPTGLSPMSELTASAGEVIARLSKIDVLGLSENMVALTATLNRKLEQIDIDSLSENLERSTGRLADLLAQMDLPHMITGIDSAIGEFRQTNVLLAELLSGASPSIARMDSISFHLDNAMASMAVTSQRTSDMLAVDAEFRQALEAALSETAHAMKSFRRLTDMLERNPRAIIAGKSEDRK